MYAGSLEECKKLAQDKDEPMDPLHLFELASRYDIPSLVSISLDGCVRCMNPASVKVYLQKAKLHSSQRLKSACFEYIQRNSSKVLLRPDMMALATEDPELWEELRTALNGRSSTKTSGKKRARNNNNN